VDLTKLQIDGPVATLTLDRPDARNALSIDLCRAVTEALGTIDEHRDVRVVILRGEGKVFCSGADLSAVSGPGALEFLPEFERMLEAVARFRLPTIARIQGAALGGGLQLATCCDFRIAASDARMGIPSSRLGIVINYENVQRLVLQVGVPTAKLVLMTGHVFSGDEAERAGLATKVTEPHSLDDEVAVLSEAIVSAAPLSVQGAKRAIAAVADQFLGTDMDPSEEIAALVAQAYHSNDLQEGLKALAEKRTPGFTGS
jgi:enoyl-CoA hydratase/carnithine racemase